MRLEQTKQQEHKNRLLKHIKTLTRLLTEREEALKVAPVNHHSFIMSEVSALKASIYALHRMREATAVPRYDDTQKAPTDP